MKQSKVFLFIGLVVCAATVIATPAKKRKLTPEEIEQRKYNFFGGYLMQPQETKVVSILNEQKIVSVSVLEKIAAEMQDLIKLPVKVNEKNNVAVTLKVCECESLVRSLFCLTVPPLVLVLKCLRQMSPLSPCLRLVSVKSCGEG